MVIEYKKAVRENVTLLIGLAGASGSGKTYSAMVLATALSGDDPFMVIDTERRRALHYADAFDFEHQMIDPPFHPRKYLEAVRAATKRGFRTIVIDSMSHEWDGEGGILEMAAAETAKPPANWIKPKAEHARMMNGLLQSDANIVFCLRAKEKMKLAPSPDNPKKTIVEYQGWTPNCEKDFMYDMTLSFTLSPEKPGVIDLSMQHKVADQFRSMFLDGTQITKAHGEGLAKWANGGSPVHPDTELWRRARNAASQGLEKLKEFANELENPEDAERLKPIGKELREIAAKADGVWKNGG